MGWQFTAEWAQRIVGSGSGACHSVSSSAMRANQGYEIMKKDMSLVGQWTVGASAGCVVMSVGGGQMPRRRRTDCLAGFLNGRLRGGVGEDMKV